MGDEIGEIAFSCDHCSAAQPHEDQLIASLSTVPERRAHKRRELSLAAVVKVNGSRGLSCRVINASPMGASLVFDHPTAVPDVFTLVVPEIWFEAECEVRHRSPARVGFLFLTSRREALASFS